MEGCGDFGLSSVPSYMKKPRTARRPRQDSLLVFGNRGASPHSSNPSSDDANKLSPERNLGYDVGNRRKAFYLNDPAPRIPSSSKQEGVSASKKIKKESKTLNELDGHHGNGSSIRGGVLYNNEQVQRGMGSKHRTEGTIAPAKWNSTSRVKESFGMQSRSPDGNLGKNGEEDNVHQPGRDNVSAENKLRKVKLKVGGVTRTIHAKSNEETGNGDNDGSSSKLPRSLDASRLRQKPFYQENSLSLKQKGNGPQGNQRKDSSGVGFSREAKEDSRGRPTEEILSGKHTDKAPIMLSSEPVRKSNRVPKRRVLDGAFDQGEEDDEIRYLERLRASKAAPPDYPVEHENGGEDVKKRKLSKVSKSKNIADEIDEAYVSLPRSKDSRKKLKPGREVDDTDYIEEEEPISDADPESKKKKQKKVSVDSPTEVRTEPLTTRQRGRGSAGASLIEFPDGLPPPPPRRQKEKLSEVEQQAKKAEAAQRRKLQVEKQAKEIQEEAIRKILGLDSDRKKEEKKQKELEEKAKAAKRQEDSSNSIKWITGPTGTIVVFPEGLPSIFDSKPCSYPPPREKCAGPSCTNPYIYRDSKSNLPLCSLRCYKAVQGSPHSVATC